jgi:hypothetical protein
VPCRPRLARRCAPNGLVATGDIRFPVKGLQDLRAKCRRRRGIADSAAQSTAHFLEILQQFAALIAVLDMQLDLSG